MENKKFIITIEETVADTFSVCAKNAEEAMSIAEKKYNNSEFVLEPGNIMSKQMSITNPENELTEWTEF